MTLKSGWAELLSACQVVNEYKCKVRKLDITFAATVVGDGNTNVIGPFENALSQFHGKSIIPPCFGAFGEVNEDLDKVIQCLAREAASTDEGLTISPLTSMERKGGAYHIMLQQFWRAIDAVTAANVHSQHILQLLHNMRGTKRRQKMHADCIIVTTDGDHTSVEVIVGLICTYQRDMQCSNNSSDMF